MLAITRVNALFGPASPMPPSLQIEQAGDGILLSKFPSFHAAVTLCRHLSRQGHTPRLAHLPSHDSILVFLPKTSIEALASLMDEANA